MTFADATAGDKRSPGTYTLVVTAKSTSGTVTWSDKTVEITVRAYYKSCKGASVVSAIGTADNQSLLLAAAASDLDLTAKFTLAAGSSMCADYLAFTIADPAAITSAGVTGVIAMKNTLGPVFTITGPAADKTTIVGTHIFSITATD